MHLAVSTPLSARCTFCTTYTEGAECEHVNMWCSGTAVCALVALVHTQPAHCPFCSSTTPVLQPRVLLVIRKHSISVGRSSVSRPRAECAEKVLSSSSFGTLVLHSSSSSSSSTVPSAAGGGSGRGLAGAGVPPPRRCWAEKVKRCETAASTGSWPRPGRARETFTFIITATSRLLRQSSPRAKCLEQCSRFTAFWFSSRSQSTLLQRCHKPHTGCLSHLQHKCFQKAARYEVFLVCNRSSMTL